MLLEWICNIFFSLAYFVLKLIPSFPQVDGLNISMSPLFYVLGFINNFVSLRVVSGCLLTVLVVFNCKYVWSLICWVIKKIPGVS
ncbi:hypothetical protein EDD70_3005 [Hydrogenoanaerobacterium saccharovorans]|uniref:Uncharacterized protein n=1 Tax=Hydrogenoanaerobacterium saccharovorans TaxID=474960 RepID=A0A1H8EI96_9FIRM|nr:hypothetical protein EDD70_3005 [Hydrogenoanaerobacterium saccharovorans]SEN19202.1 hypothetical protein SAMN05216180_3031 [Hydrogenoanaerobacterium saccharovorans]